MRGWLLHRHGGPAIGLVAQLALLAVLASTVGLGAPGWVAGIGCAVTTAALLARALDRRPREVLGPASWITLGRATLAEVRQIGDVVLLRYALSSRFRTD